MRKEEINQTDKHVKISADRHKILKMQSAKEGKDMRDIMNDALDLYMTLKDDQK